MKNTDNLSWEIRYVNPDTRVAIEPYDIKWFTYDEVERAIEQVKILSEANELINGKETWFLLELINSDESGMEKVLLSERF